MFLGMKLLTAENITGARERAMVVQSRRRKWIALKAETGTWSSNELGSRDKNVTRDARSANDGARSAHKQKQKQTITHFAL